MLQSEFETLTDIYPDVLLYEAAEHELEGSRVKLVEIPKVSRAELVEIPKADIRDELKALQEIIGGYIEAVRIAADAALLVDADSYVKCLPPNPAATVLARQMVLGTALLVGLAVNEDGEMYFSECPERYYKENA